MKPGVTDVNAERDKPCRRVLVLGTTVSSRVVSVASRTLLSAPETEVTVCVPEVETWKFRDRGLELLVMGEEKVAFGGLELRQVLEDGGFDRVILPLDLPRDSLLGVARLVASLRKQPWVLNVGRITTSWRPAIVALPVLFTILVWFPLKVVERLCSAVDGAGVIAGGLAARLGFARRAGERRGEVCHVISSLGTGGTQRQVVEYLKRAGREPAQNLVALYDYNDRFQLELEAAGLEVEILARRCRSTNAGRVAIRFFPNTTALIALWWRLRSLAPSSVVSWLFQSNVVAAPAARLAGVPRIVSSIRNLSTWKNWPGYRKWWYWWADRLSASLSDEIFTNSRAAGKDYARWLRRKSLNVTVIPNGLDLDALLAAPRADKSRILDISADRLVILTVGRLSAEKDHATLLRALESLTTERRDLHLVVIGHGEFESRLRGLASQLGLEGRVTFAGRVDDPQSYFAAADLFVLTSRIEGLPNALIEAQAFGLATVTTQWKGVDDVVVDGVTAAVVPIGDHYELARAIKRLLEDDAARFAMGRAAAAACRDKFDIQKMVAAVDRISGRTSQ